jgi:hypothetical protein
MCALVVLKYLINYKCVKCSVIKFRILQLLNVMGKLLCSSNTVLHQDCVLPGCVNVSVFHMII